MGGESSRSRDNHMEDLLDAAYNQLTGKGPDIRTAGLEIREAPVAARRPVLIASARPAVKPQPRVFVNTVTISENRLRPVTVASLSSPGAAAGRPEPARFEAVALKTTTVGEAPLASVPASVTGKTPGLSNGAERARASLANWMVPPAQAATEPGAQSGVRAAFSSTPGWAVQIGAFSRQEDAQASLDSARKRLPEILSNGWSATMPVAQESRTLYRARFGGFGERDAMRACNALAKSGIACIPVAPDGWMRISDAGLHGRHSVQ